MRAQQLVEEGKTFAEQLEFSPATERFEAALKLDSKSTEAMTWLGKLALMRGAPADPYLDRALAVDPKNAEALGLKAVLLMQGGDAATALQFLEQARTSQPELPMTYGNLARCYRLLGRHDEAEAAARKALALNPKNFQAHFELACVMPHLGKTAEALQHCVASVNNNPLFLKGYVALGSIFTAAGKLNEAIRIYQRGLTFLPDAYILRDQLCVLFVQRGDLEAAMQEALESAQRRNSYGDHLRIGIYALLAGQFEMAEKAFLKSITLNANGWEAHYNLGELYLSANLVEEARKQYQAAVQAGPNEWKPYNGLGLWWLHKESDPREARKNFERAKELAPGRPEPILNLALACAAAKDWSAAETNAKEIVRRTHPRSDYFQQAQRLLDAIKTEGLEARPHRPGPQNQQA